jgi:hypothetical protein
MTVANENAFKNDVEALVLTLFDVQDKFTKVPDELTTKVNEIMKPLLAKIGPMIGDEVLKVYLRELEVWKGDFLRALLGVAHRIEFWRDEIVAAEREAAK